MLTEIFQQAIANATEQEVREALRHLLCAHATPVFGAAKTVEHEVAALNALTVLGHIAPNADEFDLVEKLRITKSKARTLLYQAALRTEGSEVDVAEALRGALATTRVVRVGELYLIEVPDPLTMDRLRKRIRNYGFISDGSFSGSIAKIPEGALIRLVEELIPKEKKAEIMKQLAKDGLPDKTIAGAIKAMLSQAGKKVAGEVVGQAAKVIGEEIGKVINVGWSSLQRYVETAQMIKKRVHK